MSDLTPEQIEWLRALNNRAFHWQAVVGAHSVEQVSKSTITALLAAVERLKEVATKSTHTNHKYHVCGRCMARKALGLEYVARAALAEAEK